MECPVCLTVYDDKVQRPRTLPCGHTFCTPCVNGLKEQGHVKCPHCRVEHAVPEAGQFPISYTIEKLLMMMSSASSSNTNPAQNLPNQRTVVWQGTLEWKERKPDHNSTVVHQVTCKMTSMVVNGEPEVKADHWASTLIMQMIPKYILGSIGNTFFKNVKSLMFIPDHSHALEILTNLLFRGMAGCVHVCHRSSPHPSLHQQSDVKVIILLYASEKKAYVGFVPIDQLSFVNKFKSVIKNARKGQTTTMMAPGAGPSLQGASTSHMGVPGNSGLQALPSVDGEMATRNSGGGVYGERCIDASDVEDDGENSDTADTVGQRMGTGDVKGVGENDTADTGSRSNREMPPSSRGRIRWRPEWLQM